MNNPNYIKEKTFSKSNGFLIWGGYFAASTYLVSQVLKGGNLPLPICLVSQVLKKGHLLAPEITTKIILLLVVLLLVSPAFGIGCLIMKLKVQHFIKTKDIYGFLLPTKGSLGNPDFSLYIGTIAKEVWLIFMLILVFLLFFSFVPPYSGMIYGYIFL